MTSTISFSGIKHTLVKSASDIKPTERAEGKLNARSIINRFSEGLQIDAFILKNAHTAITDDSITFNENDIRAGTRRTFSDLKVKKVTRLPVKVNFFKDLEPDDTIIIILRSI